MLTQLQTNIFCLSLCLPLQGLQICCGLICPLNTLRIRKLGVCVLKFPLQLWNCIFPPRQVGWPTSKHVSETSWWIIIGGVQCSGKSVFARLLTRALKRAKLQTFHLEEGQWSQPVYPPTAMLSEHMFDWALDSTSVMSKESFQLTSENHALIMRGWFERIDKSVAASPPTSPFDVVVEDSPTNTVRFPFLLRHLRMRYSNVKMVHIVRNPIERSVEFVLRDLAKGATPLRVDTFVNLIERGLQNWCTAEKQLLRQLVHDPMLAQQLIHVRMEDIREHPERSTTFILEHILGVNEHIGQRPFGDTICQRRHALCELLQNAHGFDDECIPGDRGQGAEREETHDHSLQKLLRSRLLAFYLDELIEFLDTRLSSDVEPWCTARGLAEHHGYSWHEEFKCYTSRLRVEAAEHDSREYASRVGTRDPLEWLGLDKNVAAIAAAPSRGSPPAASCQAGDRRFELDC